MKRCLKKDKIRGVVIYLMFASVVIPTHFSDAAEKFDIKRKKMVEEQIVARGISNTEVINAMLKVPRHLFVPDGLKRYAYEDTPLLIGFGQTISQPYIVAYMTEKLNPRNDSRVLEIGTGSGYQAAVLAEIVKEVYTVEIIQPLAENAERRLKELGYNNIFVKHGNGYLGWEECAPFDAIIVTAAPKRIPEKLIQQLKPGGRMVIPLGSVYQELYLVIKTEDGYVKRALLPVRFVPMVKDSS